MLPGEKVFLGLLGAGVVALLLYKFAGQGGSPIGLSPGSSNEVQAPDSSIVEPAYLSYNAPWLFGPPNVNTLPRQAIGQNGEVSNRNGYVTRTKTCGCGGSYNA